MSLMKYDYKECSKDNIIKLILFHANTDINQKDLDGRTALIWATICVDKETAYCGIKLLLKHPDINIELRDNYDKTALDYARINKNKKLIELIKSKMGNTLELENTYTTKIKRFLLGY